VRGPASAIAARIDHVDRAGAAICRALLDLQRSAYAVEAALVGSDAIPPLHETLEELQAADETFLGAWLEDALVGAVSWRIDEGVLDIHRLVVSPALHRRGVGRALVREALRLHPGLPAVVQTGAANLPARRLYETEGFAGVDEIEPVPGLRVVRLARPAGYR
jgi:GNAT superfamily N-acetyltransferase